MCSNYLVVYTAKSQQKSQMPSKAPLALQAMYLLQASSPPGTSLAIQHGINSLEFRNLGQELLPRLFPDTLLRCLSALPLYKRWVSSSTHPLAKSENAIATR